MAESRLESGRRHFLLEQAGLMKLRGLLTIAVVALGTALAGCTTGGSMFTSSYSSVRDAGYTIPRVPIERIDSKYHRQIVRYETREKPGTIIVETGEKFLYFVLPDGKAMRYGIGVGREGFTWSGTNRVTRKAEWPGWTPPPAMRAREKAKGRILPVHQKGGLDRKSVV